VAARVERRLAQYQASGVDVSTHQLSEEIEERDRLDRNRTVSPLVPAADAHEIDSSGMTADQVVDKICAIVEASR
jgi:cytidylate kinase